MKNKLISLPVLALVVLMMAGVVYGACTFATPLAGTAVLKGSQKINISCAANDDPKNCTITASSSNTGGSETFYLYNVTETEVNGTFNTLVETDADDWVLAASCKNASAQTYTVTSITGLDIDNTIPTISSCTIGGVTAANLTTESSTRTFACTVKNATTCNVYWKDTTAVDVNDGDDTNTACSSFTTSDAYAAAGQSASCVLSQIDDSQDYVYYTCTDGLNSTTTTAYYIDAEGMTDEQEEDSTIVITTQISSWLSNRKNVVIGAIGAFVIVLLLFAAFMGKKRR
jgi:hypothetical protein